MTTGLVQHSPLGRPVLSSTTRRARGTRCVFLLCTWVLHPPIARRFSDTRGRPRRARAHSIPMGQSVAQSLRVVRRCIRMSVVCVNIPHIRMPPCALRGAVGCKGASPSTVLGPMGVHGRLPHTGPVISGRSPPRPRGGVLLHTQLPKSLG